MKETILCIPTFFEHFDSLVVDWTYVSRSEKAWLKTEAEWIKKQGLRLTVDLSSGLNLYPDLRIVENDMDEYLRSIAVIEDVIDKMEILGAKDLILCLHRAPENNYTYKQTEESFVSTMRKLCEKAAEKSIVLHLRTKANDTQGLKQEYKDKVPSNFYDMSYPELQQFIDGVGCNNLKIAVSTSVLLLNESSWDDTLLRIRKSIGIILLGAPVKDIAGRIWDINAPLSGLENTELMKRLLSKFPDKLKVLDIPYENWNQVMSILVYRLFLYGQFLY